MTQLWAFLAAAVWPLAKKVLLALGIGVLTYSGLTLLATQVQNEIIVLWGQVPASMANMAALLGIPQSIGVILGGVSARVALISVGRLGRIAQ